MSDRTLKITISGQVQMVGYRWFAKRQADLLGIRGYVRNISRGEVEIYAQGKVEDLEYFMTQLRKGPSRARVQGLLQETLDTGEIFEGFRIRE